MCRLGIGRTFQIVKPFPALTVLENLRTAAMFGRAAFAMPGRRIAMDWRSSMSSALPMSRTDPAATLTLSGQKRLEVARAVATGARLVLLDEVMAGLTRDRGGAMLETLRPPAQLRGSR